MSSETRALQFGSYNFAGAIMEMVMTLMYGGCICIPSDEDRAMNLTQAINKLKPNWAFLTSTLLALIRPADVSSFRTICVGGEPIRSSQVKEWTTKVRLRKTYGSAEIAAVVASADLSLSSAVTRVGHPTTARCWLVNPSNINQLVPIGAPGEILLEGPVVGREYIGNQEKSTQAFVTAPAWREAFGIPAISSRFYRTGDLASYRSDGSHELLGSKDTQVKLRGQRIELGEIEQQARLSSPDVKEVAVELTVLSNIGPALVGFLIFDCNADLAVDKHEANDDWIEGIVRTVRRRLGNVLPYYMIPSVLLPVPTLPLTASGKTDRRRLRDMGAALSTGELRRLQSVTEQTNGHTATKIERQLKIIWASVLKVELEQLGLNDSFFVLGGDSLSAMKVVTEARKVGLALTTADVFRKNTISELALVVQKSPDTGKRSPKVDEDPLIEPSLRESLLEEIVSKTFPADSKTIEDIYPMTSVQATLVAASAGSSIMAEYLFVELSSNIDVSGVKSRCMKALQRLSILRACLLYLKGRYWTVILRQLPEPFRIISVSGDMDKTCREYCLEDTKRLLPTQPPFAFILFKHEKDGMRLFLRMSHTQYDAFCAPGIFQSIFDDTGAVNEAPKTVFADFSTYVAKRRSQSIQHWSRALESSHFTPIVPHIAISACL